MVTRLKIHHVFTYFSLFCYCVTDFFSCPNWHLLTLRKVRQWFAVKASSILLTALYRLADKGFSSTVARGSMSVPYPPASVPVLPVLHEVRCETQGVANICYLHLVSPCNIIATTFLTYGLYLRLPRRYSQLL